MTHLEAAAFLYRVQLYIQGRALHQKATEQGDSYRNNYNCAATLIRIQSEKIYKSAEYQQELTGAKRPS
jgi:hypothetical protein